MLEQHHLLEESIICECIPTSMIPCSMQAVPKLEPGMKTDVVEEHASFAKPLHELGEYLKSVMGVEAGKLYGQVVPALDKTRLPYDGAKVKAYIERFSGPLFAHVGQTTASSTLPSNHFCSCIMKSTGWLRRIFAQVE
jgi:hypothetical protein